LTTISDHSGQAGKPCSRSGKSRGLDAGPPCWPPVLRRAWPGGRSRGRRSLLQVHLGAARRRAKMPAARRLTPPSPAWGWRDIRSAIARGFLSLEEDAVGALRDRASRHRAGRRGPPRSASSRCLPITDAVAAWTSRPVFPRPICSPRNDCGPIGEMHVVTGRRGRPAPRTVSRDAPIARPSRVISTRPRRSARAPPCSCRRAEAVDDAGGDRDAFFVAPASSTPSTSGLV